MEGKDPNMQSVKKHKILVIAVIALIAAAVILFFVFRGVGSGGSSGGVYVQSVRDLTSGLSSVTRFSGVAESQKTEKVARDGQKTVKEIFVSPGDTVKKGDKLFSYDLELLQLDVQEAQLEIESIQTAINTANAQIQQYQRERSGASSSDRLAYDAQIQQLQAEINSRNYELKTKQAELERKQKDLQNAEVVSPVDGTIEAVGTLEEPLDAENTMITVRNGGDLRIKGSVSEQNVMSISVGDPVVVRSRVDREQTWAGKIESIDTGAAQKNDNDYYDGGSGDRASFYAFYVDLESADGIIMGQHVTIEPDFGQGAARTGIWLSSGFVVDPDGDAFVWAANSRMKLEKRPVTLGEYDADLDEYQILDGLTPDDLIAWADETCYAGANATTELVWDEPDGSYYDDGMDYEGVDEFDGEPMTDGEFGDGEQPGVDIPEAELPTEDGADTTTDAGDPSAPQE